MIHVRRYTPNDMGKVLPMAEAFHGESPVFRDKPFNRTKVANLLDMARDNPDWLPLVAMDDDNLLVGFALVTVQEYFFTDEKQLIDLAVYVSPTKRGASAFIKLIAAIESWARLLGASEASMGITTGINHDAALRSFAKCGYLPSGTQVSKML